MHHIFQLNCSNHPEVAAADEEIHRLTAQLGLPGGNGCPVFPLDLDEGGQAGAGKDDVLAGRPAGADTSPGRRAGGCSSAAASCSWPWGRAGPAATGSPGLPAGTAAGLTGSTHSCAITFRVSPTDAARCGPSVERSACVSSLTRRPPH